MTIGTKVSARESLSLQEFERLDMRRETRRKMYETLCEAVVYAISLAVLATGVAILHHLSTHVSMIV